MPAHRPWRLAVPADCSVQRNKRNKFPAKARALHSATYLHASLDQLPDLIEEALIEVESCRLWQVVAAIDNAAHCAQAERQAQCHQRNVSHAFPNPPKRFHFSLSGFVFLSLFFFCVFFLLFSLLFSFATRFSWLAALTSVGVVYICWAGNSNWAGSGPTHTHKDNGTHSTSTHTHTEHLRFSLSLRTHAPTVRHSGLQAKESAVNCM